MRKPALILLFVPTLLFGCKKCVECEIKLKESQDEIGHVDEFCGTNKKVEEEEERLHADYTCLECVVNTGLGEATSGVQCGNRAFTDSVEADWKQGAFDLGTTANCTYYRDTVNVTCVLK
ncbi:MAG: hypothetical protein K9G46_05440 [Flavobacteriales bacterium]|nr:hypothetical protein [Flavobacteriales bacterium]